MSRPFRIRKYSVRFAGRGGSVAQQTELASGERSPTRTHGGGAGVSGQPLPLCRSNSVLDNWEFASLGSTPHSVRMIFLGLAGLGQGNSPEVLVRL
jgi:hypothetical protein